MIIKKIVGKNGKGFTTTCRCDYCGKEFKKNYGDIGWRKHHFCSMACSLGWKSIEFSGKNNPNYGNHHSEETKQKMSKAKEGVYDGSNNPNYGKYGKYASGWRGGKTKNSKDYVLVLKPEHPLANTNGRIYEHRLIMEEKLDRYLTKEEVVHHINGIRDDNHMENLALFKNVSEHQKYHKRQLVS